MKTYWRGSYFLALLCLVTIIVLLQPRQIECCFDLQTKLPPFTSSTFLKVQGADNDTELKAIVELKATAEQKVLKQQTQKQGYVFSFPTILNDSQSTVPQIQEDSSFEEAILDSTIIPTSTIITLLDTKNIVISKLDNEVAVLTIKYHE